MENTEQKTCQVKMHGGKPCGRRVYDRDLCICHSKVSNKNVNLFQDELDRIFADGQTECYDLTGFFFNSSDVHLPTEFKKEAVFKNARFVTGNLLSKADVYDKSLTSFLHSIDEKRARREKLSLTVHEEYPSVTTFHSDVDFSSTEFDEIAHFDGVLFHGQVDFRRSKFTKGASFHLARFKEDALFENAQFEHEVSFWCASFFKNADFGDALFRGTSHFQCGFSGDTGFSRARFLSDSDLSEARFEGRTLFEFARFEKDASFFDTHFLGPTSFCACEFAGITMFTGTFAKQVEFIWCQAGENARITFDGGSQHVSKMFVEGADFSALDLTDPKQIRFHKVSLEKCRFIETDVSAAEFTDVKWDMKGKLLRRNAVFDDVSPNTFWTFWRTSEGTEKAKEPPKYQYSLIAQLYRRLQANYVKNYRYAEASDFYVGEQEMIRKAKGRVWQYLSTNFLYKIISYYGESFLLPLFWLLAVLFLFPLYLIYDGIIKDGYSDAFWKNLSFVTFNRADISKYVTKPYQQGIVTIEGLLLVVLVTFFVLALRRQYKRKTF